MGISKEEVGEADDSVLARAVPASTEPRTDPVEPDIDDHGQNAQGNSHADGPLPARTIGW